MPQASIIILTYNSSAFIKDLLKSLLDFGSSFEILVVDNASSDDTLSQIKKLKQDVKIIETGSNLGFAKGINVGAKNSSAEYLLFVNPDTQIKNGKIQDLISVFKQNEKIGVVGAKLISRSGKAEKSAGRFFGLIEAILIILGLDEAMGIRYSPNKLTKVDFVSGGFMAVRKNLFEKLGGFDENFFMYVEDMEFCYRLKKAGFKTYFTPDVIASHIGQGSSNRAFAIINIYKGILYFYKKHKNYLEYLIIKTGLFSKALGVYLLGVLTNNSYYKSTYGQVLKIF